MTHRLRILIRWLRARAVFLRLFVFNCRGGLPFHTVYSRQKFPFTVFVADKHAPVTLLLY
jgi:hypothetical protein